ncbi:PIG-L family deacetylase [Streptomyces sp. NPDC002506]|uniref:PIG-L family deacetylase n=1 Tax=Streptomyces sp. NPDC002506 TaxID=3154536 RepID=UPI00332B3A9E
MGSTSRRSAPSRRTFMAGSAAVVLAGAAGYAATSRWGDDGGSDGTVATDGARAVRAESHESVLQIIAHPDDDLFFMNPDTGHSIRSGRPMTSVYVTSGEADGVNAPGHGGPGRPMPAADRARYAQARQNGIRAAYAQMATGDKTSPWDRTSLPTVGGATAELNTLRAHPQISLVWLQLREAREMFKQVPHSLRGLWNGQTPTLEAMLAPGTPARPFTYTKDQLVDVLAGLMRRFRPTHVRTLDPTPGQEEARPHVIDHQDHVFSARFAQAALQRYAATSDRPHFTVQTYLGYNTSYLPHTFGKEAADAKAETVKTYAWMDPNDNYCHSPAGCGDRKVSNRPYGNNWAQSVRYSRANSASWLQADRDGGLWAFGVLDQKLAVWHKAPGAEGAWAGPRLLAADGPLDTGLTSALLPDGRIAVSGTRSLLGKGADYRRDVVTVLQQRPGGDFGPFQPLGSPARSGPTAQYYPSNPAPTVDGSGPLAGGDLRLYALSDLSAPAAAVDGSGRLTVFVRGGDLRLYATGLEPSGTWSAWADLGGSGLHGDPVATTDEAGRTHVVATTARSVWTWTQPEPGAALPTRPAATGLPATAASGLSACPDGDRVRVFFRKPDSGAVQTAVLDGSGRPVVVDLGGVGGYGAVGLCGAAVAGRGPDGTLGTARAAGGTPRWTTAELLIAGAPAGIRTGADGVLAALGLDARLYWTCTTADGSPTGSWLPAEG